jgi:hypothetical protein
VPNRVFSSPGQCFPVTLLHHLGGGLGVDLRGLDLRVAEEFLDLLQGHAAFQERGGHRVAQEVRVHPLCHLGLGRGFFEDLLDPGGRVAGVAVGLEQTADGTVASMGAEFVRKKGKDGDVTQLAALGLGEEILEELQGDTKMTQIAERGAESRLHRTPLSCATPHRLIPAHLPCILRPEYPQGPSRSYQRRAHRRTQACFGAEET